MEYEDLKKSLERDYFIIKKRNWMHFLAGAVIFLVLSGVISVQATREVLKGTVAKKATNEIEKLVVEAEGDRKKISEHLNTADTNLMEMERKLRAMSTFEQSLTDIRNLIERGNPWESFSQNIKDVIRDRDTYEYALIRNGYFRTVTASEWNSGWRVMTSPYMTGDSETFTLGGSAWIWDTKDPRDKDGVFHLYYYASNEGIIARSGNGLTKADEGGEGTIYRRPRK